ncbi:MAG: GNAT family N-acetyltransferase [Pseudolabrys sp.]
MTEGQIQYHAEHRVALRDGTPVLLRPLTAADGALYPDFQKAVDAQDFRLRFFSPLRQLSPEFIDKLTHYDPKIAMASIAIEETAGIMLGVVRLHDDPAGGGADLAVIIRSHLKGRGLGWAMMRHMIAYAKSKGLKSVRGQVLAENSTMLIMCKELGFHVTDDPGERGVKQVTLPLNEVPALAD